MGSFGLCFWTGLAVRLGCVALLHGRAPGGFLGLSLGSLGYETAASVLSGLGLWTLVRWFRKAHGPKGDPAALKLAWFFAVFWAFPLLYSQPSPLGLRGGARLLALDGERAALALALGLVGQGCSAVVLGAFGLLFGVGSAMLALVRLKILLKNPHPKRLKAVVFLWARPWA